MLLRLYEVNVDKNPPPGLDEKWTDSERYNDAIETFGLGSPNVRTEGQLLGQCPRLALLEIRTPEL